MRALQLCLSALFCFSSTAPAQPSRPQPTSAIPGDYVILLHGYGRTALSMKRLEWHLRRRGYHVINLNYSCGQGTVETIAEDQLHPALESCGLNATARIHFVTHSLGGIILRQYLLCHPLERLGRVVMLAPPNHGSAIIDHARGSRLWRSFLRPAVLELGTHADDLPARLGPVAFECAVIAGDRSLNPLLSSLLTGPNDGKVAVASTRIDGMKDFLVVHQSHTWLMWRASTINQTIRFLESGLFGHNRTTKDLPSAS